MITQLQSQIQETELKYKALQTASESRQTAEQLFKDMYPKLADFTTAQDYMKVDVVDTKGTKSIMDSAILNSISAS